MKYEIKCSKCGRSSATILDSKCSCGSPLETHLHFNFEKKNILKRKYSLWRYVSFFPYVNKKEIVSLGEGWTPLIKFSDNVYFKLDNLNLISAVHKPLKRAGGYISEDSSGNAGASIAAYAARAGLKAEIYVPESVSGPKLSQIKFYGAEVVKVSGSRCRVAEEAQKSEKRKFYVGHILHPLFRDGIRSVAYELVEEFGWRLPDLIYLPVSAGTLLLGVIKGFGHLEKSGLIDFPEIIACQTRQVSPLYHRFKGLSYTQPKRITSIADALVSVDPPLLDLMIKNLKEADGNTVIVEEEEIFNAFTKLARKGFFIEPSSAVAYAAYKKQLEAKETSKNDKAVIVLTGNGLKSKLRPTLRINA